MTLYILKYNNYYNRLVKSFDNMEDYEPYINYTLQTTNFNPNDGVDTQQLVGSGDYDGKGDYVIIADTEASQTGWTEVIKSRWFIIEAQRTRSGQWNLTLHRDVIADYYNIILESPMFIEKATLLADNPLIFNSENMSVNQIKKNEYLLRDNSFCPWIVGYYAKDANIVNGTVPTNDPLDVPYIQLATAIEQWDFYEASNLKDANAHYIDTDNTYTYVFNFDDFIGPPYGTVYRSSINSSSSGVTYDFSWEYDKSLNNPSSPVFGVQVRRPNSGESGGPGGGGPASDTINVFRQEFPTALMKAGGINALNTVARNYLRKNNYNISDLLALQGSVLRDTNGKVFLVQSVHVGSWTETKVDAAAKDSLFIGMDAITDHLKTINNNNGYPYVFGEANSKTYTLIGQTRTYSATLVPVEVEQLSYNITTNRLFTTDSAYDIFAIPYGELDIRLVGESQNLCTTSAEIAINTAMAIQKNNPNIVYDIQILPYCPVQELLDPDGFAALYLSSEEQYSKITKGDEVYGVILNIPKSRFTFNIRGWDINTGATAIERKINNECDKWRLCSPNYSNSFDFSVEKNNGVSYFNVDCDYKPFTPYIHVNPNFNGLYGQDYNDPRGLICGGDFSITQVVDQWQQYQIQNKNFQNIFDRQIQNMEVQNKYQREMDRLSAIVGTVQGGAAGASTALISSGGNPYAAIAGAAVGTVASGLAGYADMNIKEALRTEAMDYTKDLFGYQLGNIQALPQTLSKVSALNGNNKLFPVLEYYTCTDTEKEALLNKIAWNGMTVMTIGTMNDYINNTWNYKDVADKGYIKGKLIRLNTEEDFHIVNAISEELYKGVYTR